MGDKDILDFNLWHGTELVMGQVAHFDTYLDMCFLSLVLKCEMWGLVIPVTCFIILMQSYPIVTILSLCRVNKNLAHTQPYLERNCHLSFIRENMLLATVLDRFAINNTLNIRGKAVAYGKFNGGWTFMCQDLPQFSIHLFFLFFMHDPDSTLLHADYVVKLSLCISFFAFSISLFNFTMFKPNEFNPMMIEKQLAQRRKKTSEEKSELQKIESKRKKEQFKEKMLARKTSDF